MSLTDNRGKRFTDDTLLILLNSCHEAVDFGLPLKQPGRYWKMCPDTEVATGKREFSVTGGDTFQLGARSPVMSCARVKGERERTGDIERLKDL